jgi:hypothetical protein
VKLNSIKKFQAVEGLVAEVLKYHAENTVET